MHRLRRTSIDWTTAPRLLLLTGIFLSPSVFDVGSAKPFDAPKLAVLWFFGWLALAITLVEVIRRDARLVRCRLAAVAGVFLAVTIVSTVFSRARLLSVFGWYARYNGLLEIALYVVIFWLVVQLYWRRPERLKEVFLAIAAASIVLTVYILIQWIGLDPFNWVQPTGQEAFRFVGTMGNSNFAGGYLGATSAWLVFAFWRTRRLPVRAALVFWGFVTLFALVQTSSRNGLAAGFASAVVAVVVFRRRLPRLLTAACLALAALVVIAGAALAVNAVRHDTGRGSPSEDDLSLTRRQTLVVRSYWWRSALRIVGDRPFVGSGPDTFIAQYPRYALRESAGLPGAERTDEPHNIFLEHAASLGILGIGAYLALIVLAARWGWRCMNDVDETERDLLGSFLVLGAGYLAQGFFSIDIPPLAALGWVALAGIAALADPAVIRARGRLIFSYDAPTRGRSSWRRSAAASVVAAVLAVVVVSGLRPWLADRAARQAQREAAHAESTAIVMSSFRRAMALAPYESVYRGSAASFLVGQASRIDDKAVRADLLTDAVELHKQMDELLPGNARWKTSIANTLSTLAAASGDVGYFEEAENWYDDAAGLAPYDRRIPFAHGLMLSQWGQTTRNGLKYCEAIDSFRRAIELRPEKESYTELARAYAATGHIDAALEALTTARATWESIRGPGKGQSEVLKATARISALKARKPKVISCG